MGGGLQFLQEASLHPSSAGLDPGGPTHGDAGGGVVYPPFPFVPTRLGPLLVLPHPSLWWAGGSGY